MYEACSNNNFTNTLLLYIIFLFLLLFSPFLFVWELIAKVRSCFRQTENMSGKVVLITGASSGLGELMAYEYVKRGAQLAIIAIKEPESRLEQVVLVVFADVSKVTECKKFIDDTIMHFGRLDHLVMNAGIASVYSLSTDITKFTPVMDVNFWGSVYPTHFAIPYLQKTQGKIIVNASAGGVLHPPKGGFYNASKAALISFYESLRFQVSPRITITILTLGFIQTDLITVKYSTSGGVHRKKDLGSVFPAMGAEACAKGIVDGVCKGATSITEPRFFKALFFIRFMFPELHRFYYNIFFYRKPPKDR